MNELRPLALGLALALTALAGRVAAQAPSGVPLSESGAVQNAVEHNPNLHVALLQEIQAGYSVSAEEALYAPVFDASTGYTHSKTPGLQRAGGTSISTTDTVDVGAGLTKAFPTGTVVGLTVAGQRSVRRYPLLPTSPSETQLGPGYSLVSQLNVTQPFLRGAGSEIGLASLRQARLNRTAARLAAQQTASQTLRDVLNGYWELWYSGEAVRINQASRDLAETQRKQAHDRVLTGDYAQADELSYATQVATLDEAVVSSTTDRRQHMLTLGQLMGSVGGYMNAADQPPEDIPQGPDSEQAVSQAVAASYQLRKLETDIALAREQARIAGDPLRPRLDADAYVQAQGLGNQEVPPALEQFGKMQAVSVHVGLTFEMPLTDTRRQSQIQNALLSIRIGEKQLEAGRQQLKSDVLSAIVTKEAARQRLDLSRETEKIAARQVEAEQGRFVAGTSLAIQVMQAQEAYRQAQLRVQRARIDVVEAEINLLHLRGKLLERYAPVVSQLRAEDNGPTIGSTWGPM